MSEEVRHTMIRVNKDIDGVEEWHCPTCGRRFLMQWPPNYKRTVLEPGDEAVIHVGGQNEKGSEETEVENGAPLTAEEMAPIDEQRLIPWLEWAQVTHLEERLDAA
jgi:hypothetical protein